jgi:hypothetical protein
MHPADRAARRRGPTSLLDGLRVREREREGLQADLAHLQGLQRVGRDLDRGRLTTAMRAQLADRRAPSRGILSWRGNSSASCSRSG